MERTKSRSLALAYAITGLAVAVALIALVGVTTDLFGARTPPPSEAGLVATPADGALVPPAVGVVSSLPNGPSPAAPTLDASPSEAERAASQAALLDPAAPEIVYVDAPPSPRSGHDDDDDDHDDERHGRRGEREHDDD